MFLSAIAPLLLIPYAVAAGVHKLKLKKFDTAPVNPSLESAYLAEKYGAQVTAQLPLLGSGGQGRRLGSRPVGDDLYWTQEEILNGGHKVPLTSAPPISSSSYIRRLTCACLFRFHECTVLYRDFSRNTPTKRKSDLTETTKSFNAYRTSSSRLF
jgi:hypothetical protein